MEKFNIDPKLALLEEEGKHFRHTLHKIPEASGQEFKTTAFCQEQMKSFGYTLTTYEHFTGFIADLNLGHDHTIAFRTDIDALEMPDLTTNEHKSTHEGLAHNCGHDMHMAISLLSAKFLAQNKDQLRKNVRFIFQMAEEDMKVPGANKMVELGCVENVDEIFALHNMANMEYGCVDIKEGVMSSYGSAWTLQIKGKSAHGSTPQKGLDAIREGARIIADMDYIVAKKTDPFCPAVFSCGMFHGGTIPNAISDFIEARGTIRSMDAATDEILKQSFKELENESRLRGFDTTFTYAGYPAIINHENAYQKVIKAVQATLKDPNMLNAHCQPMTGSEDFSYMVNATRQKKGAMFFLGSGNSQKGICNYLHSNPYYVEDKAILVGAQIFVRLAMEQ